MTRWVQDDGKLACGTRLLLSDLALAVGKVTSYDQHSFKSAEDVFFLDDAIARDDRAARLLAEAIDAADALRTYVEANYGERFWKIGSELRRRRMVGPCYADGHELSAPIPIEDGLAMRNCVRCGVWHYSRMGRDDA